MYRTLIVLIVSYNLFLGSCNAQTTLKENTVGQYTEITKKQIKNLGVYEIRDYSYSDSATCMEDSCYAYMIFENGRLRYDGLFNGMNYKNSLRCADEYNYIDTTENILKSVKGRNECNVKESGTHITTYKYINNQMINSTYKYFDRIYVKENTYKDSLTNLFTTTYYYKNNRLNYIMYKNGIQKFFIYKKDVLIGYYPAKNYKELSLKSNKSDSIYSERKVNELKKNGVNNFSKKYLNGTVLNKAIDDCYKPVKNDQLLINGKPVKDFLARIGKKNTKYIIFEIADNYFLFYKIID